VVGLGLWIKKVKSSLLVDYKFVHRLGIFVITDLKISNTIDRLLTSPFVNFCHMSQTNRPITARLEFDTTLILFYLFIYLFKINDRRTRGPLMLSEEHRNT